MLAIAELMICRTAGSSDDKDWTYPKKHYDPNQMKVSYFVDQKRFMHSFLSDRVSFLPSVGSWKGLGWKRVRREVDI